MDPEKANRKGDNQLQLVRLLMPTASTAGLDVPEIVDDCLPTIQRDSPAQLFGCQISSGAMAAFLIESRRNLEKPFNAVILRSRLFRPDKPTLSGHKIDI